MWLGAKVEIVCRQDCDTAGAAGAPAMERTTTGEDLEVLARRLSQYSINLGWQVGGVAFCCRTLANGGMVKMGVKKIFHWLARTLHDVDVCTNGSDIRRRIGKKGQPAFREAERLGTIGTMGQIEREKRETIHRHIALRGEGGVQDRCGMAGRRGDMFQEPPRLKPSKSERFWLL
ncbi:hypothetical protein C8R44DRAFT_736056 [Mycena epipterygia]|nr:hypothetical protein C8R44DRAFT_736056 [Mycena epipterygia]